MAQKSKTSDKTFFNQKSQYLEMKNENLPISVQKEKQSDYGEILNLSKF